MPQFLANNGLTGSSGFDRPARTLASLTGMASGKFTERSLIQQMRFAVRLALCSSMRIPRKRSRALR